MPGSAALAPPVAASAPSRVSVSRRENRPVWRLRSMGLPFEDCSFIFAISFRSRCERALLLFGRLFEVAQIRWRLVLLGWHEVAVPAHEVDFIPDGDMHVVFGANLFLPPDRLLGLRATVVLDDDPGARERVVDRGNLVVQNVAVSLVEVDALLDNCLIVLVHWDAGHLECAGALHAAGLDHKRVV